VDDGAVVIFGERDCCNNVVVFVDDGVRHLKSGGWFWPSRRQTPVATL
jgi:hypothetical protein